MTVQDALEAKDVVSGILPINTINAYVLFDLGATCSFISEDFAAKLCIPQQQLDNPLNVEIANREIIPVDKVCKNCFVDLRGHNLEVDLIPIRLGEFDVILGMDWLSNHGVVIDCQRKCIY